MSFPDERTQKFSGEGVQLPKPYLLKYANLKMRLAAYECIPQRNYWLRLCYTMRPNGWSSLKLCSLHVFRWGKFWVAWNLKVKRQAMITHRSREYVRCPSSMFNVFKLHAEQWIEHRTENIATTALLILAVRTTLGAWKASQSNRRKLCHGGTCDIFVKTVCCCSVHCTVCLLTDAAAKDHTSNETWLTYTPLTTRRHSTALRSLDDAVGGRPAADATATGRGV